MNVLQQSLIFSAVAFVLALLQTPQSEYRVEIKKTDFKMYIYKGDSLVKTFSVAVGRNPGDKQRRGDFRTPEGSFSISQIQDSQSWSHDFKDGKGSIGGAYGPLFLRFRWRGALSSLARLWTGIGIHGTHDPASIGTMATEGCIRLKNEELKELAKLVKIGTPVEIVP